MSVVQDRASSVQVDRSFLQKMGIYIDDQIALGKVLQAEIDYLTGNTQVFTPKDFLNDLKSRRNHTI